MHIANLMWLSDCAILFKDCFGPGKRILEIGSNIDMTTAGSRSWGGYKNGPVKSIFGNWSTEYVGLDLVPGRGVDIVGDAADYDFKGEKFDAILNLSVMEHTPRWRDIMARTLPLMKPGGVYLISCGCENNQKHAPEPWAQVPSMELLDSIHKAGEDYMVIYAGFEEFACPMTDTPGCFDIAVRNFPITGRPKSS